MSAPTVSGEIEISALGARLRRRWWIVVLCAIIGAVAGYAYSHTQQKRYEATSTVLVVEPNGALVSTNAVNSYAQLVTSQGVLQQVVANASPTISSSALRNDLSVTVPANTDLVSITVTTPGGQESAQLANALGHALVRDIGLLLRAKPRQPPASGAKLVSQATPPSFPSTPNKKIDILVGAVVGLFVSLAFVLAFPLRNRSRDRDAAVTRDLGAAEGSDGGTNGPPFSGDGERTGDGERAGDGERTDVPVR